jgi:hypothetical protein
MLPYHSASITGQQKLAAWKVPSPVLCAYAGFASMGFLVFHTIAGGEFSSVLTMSALAQCLGVSMLCIQSITSGSAAGISAKSLILDALAILFRLSSTLFLDGYLPADKSGDHVYQIFDICSLLLLLFLLHRVLIIQRITYQATEDTMGIVPVVLACVGLAAVLHGDMDADPIYDTTWLAGLVTSVVAVMPQFWLITRTGGWAASLTSHYIAAMALSRLLSGSFMWMARQFVTCHPYIGTFQHTIVAILIAHFVHAIMLGDFAFHYIRSLLRGGFTEPMHFEV